MWKRIAIYGALLAAGTLGLQWLDYQRLARTHTSDIYIALMAIAFLGLGVYIGMRVLDRPNSSARDGRSPARSALIYCRFE
ncbi:luxR family transcriptional regulator [Asticcacaulis biprosthecium C19]|uniref:LuxR family transcriptional regulator n=1 Tax=Asticcacaulis biprosthecium C19 TaxID=715226 RepID=F4QMJ1_9CAUL|nr:hypothetical protein [Asticcacaulis biprosthecium]EGF91432.1 luxR family transcriptional regulator [Asticcacaulis biprosthecium C19]